jgi:hypothetical protein
VFFLGLKRGGGITLFSFLGEIYYVILASHHFPSAHERGKEGMKPLPNEQTKEKHPKLLVCPNLSSKYMGIAIVPHFLIRFMLFCKLVVSMYKNKSLIALLAFERRRSGVRSGGKGPFTM